MNTTRAKYILLAVIAVSALLLGYSAVYFSYHDSPYAEACPEQKTLFWCK
jgi:hypothetical protein